MRAFAARLAAAALCVLFAHAAARAQVADGRWANGVTEPWWLESATDTAEQAAAARALWEHIGAGPGEARDGWAGDYLIHLEVRARHLRWSPSKGFVYFYVNTCTASVTELDYGEVVADTPSHVEVISRRPGAEPRPRRYVKVRWGERRFLVEEHAVAGFCDYVAGLGAYNAKDHTIFGPEFFSRVGDGDRPTAVLPTVAPEYQKHVRRPIDARVTRVGKPYVEVDPENEWWDELVTPVRVNVGSDHGLKRGMTLTALDSDEYDERVELTRVGTNYAHGIIVRSVRKRPGVPVNEWDDGKDEPGKPAAVGWRLTTSLHKRLLHAEQLPAAGEGGQGKN